MSTTTMKKICSIFIGAVTAPAAGQWIDLPASNEEIQSIIDEIQRTECEEYIISDYEGLLNVNEFSNPFELNDQAAEIEGLEDEQQTVIECLMSEAGYSFSEALDQVTSGDYRIYEDCHDMTDVAYMVVDEMAYLENVPDNVARYFDYEAFGRDLGFEGQFYCSDIGYVEVW